MSLGGRWRGAGAGSGVCRPWTGPLRESSHLLGEGEPCRSEDQGSYLRGRSENLCSHAQAFPYLIWNI